ARFSLRRGWFGGRAALGVGELRGLAVAALPALQSDRLFDRPPAGPQARAVHAAAAADAGWRMLFSWPILQNLLFFVLLAITSGGVSNYSVVALGALHQTPISLANAALSAFLLLSALGVLAGGLPALPPPRHRLLAP